MAASNKTKVALFAVLLGTLLLLVVLFASGVLKFGLSQQFTYILYTVAGLVAAVLCFGILSSRGTASTTSPPYRISLGGAIVAFVVVCGGGMIYEKYFHTPEFMVLTILFVNEDNNPQKIDGQVTLFIRNEPKDITLTGDNRVTFQGIPSSFLGTKPNISLTGDFEIDGTKEMPAISEDAIHIYVKRSNPYVDKAKASIEIGFEECYVVGFLPQPDMKSATFTFRLRSLSEKALPISRDVVLKLLDHSGVPVFTENHRLSNSITLQPGIEQDAIVDLLIPQQIVQASVDKTVSIDFKYESFGKGDPLLFSEVFSFARDKIHFQ